MLSDHILFQWVMSVFRHSALGGNQTPPCWSKRDEMKKVPRYSRVSVPTWQSPSQWLISCVPPLPPSTEPRTGSKRLQRTSHSIDKNNV